MTVKKAHGDNANSSNTRFNQALAAHQRGDLTEAERGYREILLTQPKHVDANILLGTISVQRGAFRQAVELLTRGLELQPDHGVAHANLGLAYHELGELDRAVEHYRLAIKDGRPMVDALSNLGCAYREQGMLDAAESTLQQAIALYPNHAANYYNLGLVYNDRHDWPRAKKAYREAIARDRNYFQALFNLGNVLREEGDYVSAIRNYDRVLAIKPNFLDALIGKGVALFATGRKAEALQQYETAMGLNPNYAEGLCNIGAWYEDAGNREKAMSCYLQAADIRPDFVIPLCNIAHLLMVNGNLDEALQRCEQALARNPVERNAHMNRGIVLLKMLRLADAQREFEWCLKRNARDIEALLNLGSCYSLACDAKQALTCAENALAIDPRNALAHWNRGWALLSQGNTTEGWREFEWGTQTSERALVQKYPYPFWQGEDLSEKTILVYGEQGVGDEVLLASCFHDLGKRAKRVILQCDPRLEALFRRSFPQFHVHGGERQEDTAWLAQFEPIDVQAPSGGLPAYLRPTLASFPAESDYLVADPLRVMYWRERLALLPPGRRVGLAWRSRLRSGIRSLWYPELLGFAPILKTPGVQFVNVQYDDCTAELATIQRELGVTVHNFQDINLLTDLDDSVALMSALDIVIAPAVSTAVLAAASGTPTWQCYPRTLSAWRLGQQNYPWLPRVRIYEQSDQNDWAPVMLRISKDLADCVARQVSDEGLVRGQQDDELKQAAVAAHKQGRYVQAIEICGRLLNKFPSDVAVMTLQGDALIRDGQLAAAERVLLRAAALAPANEELVIKLGRLYQQLGRRDDELDCYRRAMQHQPGSLVVRKLLANALTNDRRFGEAAAYWYELKKLAGGDAETLFCLATCLRADHRDDEARQQFAELLQIDPTHAKGLEALGDLSLQRENLDDAEKYYQRAWQVDSHNATLLVKCGDVAARRGDMSGAYFQYQQAIAVDPEYAMAHYNAARAALALGDFAEGWREWPWRKQVDGSTGFDRAFAQIPPWTGQPVSGRTLLVHGEHDLGDELLFGSCLPTLIAQNAGIILQCDKRLVPLFARSFPTIAVHGDRETELATRLLQLGTIDFQCASGDLPMYTRRTLKDFPATHRFLHADPLRVKYWRDELAKLGNGPKIGIAWRSRDRNVSDERAYPNLEHFDPLLKTQGVVWVSLQHDDCKNEVAAIEQRLGVAIYQVNDLDVDQQVDELAALMTALDVVVSSEAATYKLAGALGVETWLLLAHVPESPWIMLGSEQMPWYPTVKVFRPETPGDWRAPVALIAAELTRLVTSKPNNGTLQEQATAPATVTSAMDDMQWFHACDALLRPLMTPQSVVCCVYDNQSDVIINGVRTRHEGLLDKIALIRCDIIVLAPRVDAVRALKSIRETVARTRPLLLLPMPASELNSEIGGVLCAHAYDWMTQESVGSFGSWSVFCPMIAPTAQHPSARFDELLRYYQMMHTNGYTRVVGELSVHTDAQATFPGNELPDHIWDVRRLIEQTNARSVLDYGAGKGVQYRLPIQVDGVDYPSICHFWGGVTIACYEPALNGRKSLPAESFDGVVCTDVLEHIPQQDIPWVIEEIFSHARRFVFASIACYPAMARLPNGENAHVTIRSPEWWKGVFETIAARYPSVRCLLKFDEVATDAKAQSH